MLIDLFQKKRREKTPLVFSCRESYPQTNLAMATHTVKQLQSFWIARGVGVSGQRRLELTELCELARELNLQVDPDNLIED